MSATTADDRLTAAWEKARRLPDYHKEELVDFIEFLESRVEDEADEDLEDEDVAAIRAVLTGEERADIPLEDVMRESRELGDRVLD
jgi:hypothetical protein